jgi:hypothetical protein
VSQNHFVFFPQLKTNHDIPYTRVHLTRLERKGIFPAAVWLGPNRKAWILQEIEEYKANRPRSRPEAGGDAQDAAD